MFRLFYEGGILGMSILTVELIAMLLAAWKMPAIVKEIGLIALLTGFFWQAVGVFKFLDFIQQAEQEFALSVYAGGLKVSMIPVFFGMAIYFVSLVLRAVQKPKI